MNFMRIAISFTLLLLLLTGCVENYKSSTNSQSIQNKKEIEYGRKLVLIMGCNDCHSPGAIGEDYGPEDEWLLGSDLGFNGPYGTLYATNLRLLIDAVSEDEWIRLAQKMRLDSPMAWSQLPQLNTNDLEAIYRFIKYLGPKGVKAPQGLPPGEVPKTEYFYFPLPH
jgi:hypothetical protein